MIAASILLGAVIGALTCSYLSEKRGRKGTLVMLAVVFGLVKNDDRDAGRDVLGRVRPSGYDVEDELDEMADLTRREQTAKTRGWPGLRAKWVRPALVLGCGIAIFTQLSGIEMIIYCSSTILTDSSCSERCSSRATVVATPCPSSLPASSYSCSSTRAACN